LDRKKTTHISNAKRVVKKYKKKMIIFFAVITGLIVGSFLNVCIYRMPKSKSIVSPRSFCPHCKHPIPWHDNIPVLSFFMLKGRCRFCKGKISSRYILVELLTALLFALFINTLGLNIITVIFIAYGCGMIVATFIDFEYQIIPDEITYGGMGLGVVLSFILPQIHEKTNRLEGLSSSLLGLLVGGIIIYLTGVLGKLLFKKEAMGGGDIKFLAMVGSIVGYKSVIFIYFLAPFFGAAVGIIMKLRYKVDVIPYGPYLSLASLIVILWERDILKILFPYL
jgi:leader peptidase (prepilin peptidase)/N-methyltransferase